MSLLTLDELTKRSSALTVSPSDMGTVDMIVVRTGEGIRETPVVAELTRETGVTEDHWSAGPYSQHPEMQISMINRHLLDLVADGERDRWALAGDNLIVDFDIGVVNLPPKSRVKVGSAVLEISAKPHRGCAKFAGRFGPDARKFVNLGDGPEKRLRGVYATVVLPGSVDVGSLITKI